jgi:hypothetical protein
MVIFRGNGAIRVAILVIEVETFIIVINHIDALVSQYYSEDLVLFVRSIRCSVLDMRVHGLTEQNTFSECAVFLDLVELFPFLIDFGLGLSLGLEL